MLSCLCCSFRGIPTSENRCKIPLTSVSFSTKILNSLAFLSLTQTFENQESNPIECDYIFTIPEDSLVQSLKLHLPNKQTLTAHLKPLEEALETYQDSISQGNTVALGKQDQYNKISLLIGNLAAGESLKVEFSLIFPLNSDESFWKFSIPADFLPESKNFLIFSFSVQISSQSPISDYSSNCRINWEISHDLLKLEGKETFQDFSDKHFWVKFKSEETNRPSCFFQEVNGEVFAMISFIPFDEEVRNLEDVEGKGEFFFVLDRSASMKGDRIEMAKKAAVLFLNSLPTGSLFNVVSFGTSFEMLHSKSLINTSKNVKIAVKAIMSFTSNMGGTNLYEPLLHIFSQKTSQDFPRTIFLLTDGQVNNTCQVISLIESFSGSSRVHGFGIGEDVDSSLIRKSAKAGKGTASFISDSQEIGKKVISALKKCILPSICSWGIDLQGESYPATEKLGNVYYGERCLQFIKLAERPTKVTVSFFDNFKKELKEFMVSEFRIIQGDSLMKLWNKAKVDYLMMNPEENREEIKNISVFVGIPTFFTAFVCVVENEEAVSGEMVTRKVVKSKYFGDGQNVRNFHPGINKGSSLNSLMKSSSGSRGYLLGEKTDYTSKALPLSTLSKKSLGNVGDINFDKSDKMQKLENLEKFKSKKYQVPLDSKNNYLQSVPGDGIKLEEKILALQQKKQRLEMLKVKKHLKMIERSSGLLKEEKKVDSRNIEPDSYFRIISAVESEGFWKYQEFIKFYPKIDSLPLNFSEVSEKLDILCTLFIMATLHKDYQDKFEEWILLERKASKWLKSKGIEYKTQLEIVLLLV